MIDIEEAIIKKYPVVEKLPQPIKNPFFGAVKKIIHQGDINQFLQEHKKSGPFSFTKAVLEHFNFSYKVSSNQIENIPSSGRVVIIANHPLGALDALSLIDLVKSIRSDITVVANEILSEISQLKDILISVDTFGSKFSKDALSSIYKSLDDEKAVIIFPSGEVSRVRPTGVRDIKWSRGFLKFAKKKMHQFYLYI